MTRPDRSRLSVLDATFLRIETAETPMHVGGLQIFELPADAEPDFVATLVAAFRRPGPLVPPFGRVLLDGVPARLLPASTTATAPDMEYHVRHTALPAPGGERELGDLISHLHGTRLDRSRPLWTCHVIEGLEDRRFAIYLKIHHALTDGVNGMRLTVAALADDPTDAPYAPWQERPQVSDARARGKRPARATVNPVSVGWDVARALGSLVRRDGRAPVLVPFEAPSSVLNGRVTAARRVATQQLDLAVIRDVADRSGASINDVFVTVCGAALRRYLTEQDSLPQRSLVAGVPVSLRAEGQEGGNAVGFVWTALGTDVENPFERLMAVRSSMGAAKEHLRRIAASARPVFTMLTMLPPIAVLLSGQGARLRPSMNVVISNVPGPAGPKYLGRARLVAFYPISIALQGMGLNITCISYDGTLDVGVVGDRDALPHLQRIAVYMGEALAELSAGPSAL